MHLLKLFRRLEVSTICMEKSIPLLILLKDTTKDKHHLHILLDSTKLSTLFIISVITEQDHNIHMAIAKFKSHCIKTSPSVLQQISKIQDNPSNQGCTDMNTFSYVPISQYLDNAVTNNRFSNQYSMYQHFPL